MAARRSVGLVLLDDRGAGHTTPCRLEPDWLESHRLARYRFAGSGSLHCGPVSAVAILSLHRGAVPRSVFLLQAALVLVFAVSARVAVRLAVERRERGSSALPLRRALIYGAGSAGQALLRELQRKPRIGYRPAGFVDDNESLHGQIVHGLPVLGDGPGLSRIVAAHTADEILIAIPSVGGQRLAEIVTYCDQAGRPCKTIPSVEELIRKPERVTDLRRVNLEELLGREPVKLDLGAISREVAGRVVMVTGAAGSIGSEICRQLASFRPASRGVGYRRNAALPSRERVPRALCLVPLLPTIGDVREEARHAAADARKRGGNRVSRGRV